MVKGIADLLMMIPKGGKYAKSVVNFVHKVPKNWPEFKLEIEMFLNLLKGGKLKLHGKQKTIFETNKNILKAREKVIKDAGAHMKKELVDIKGKVLDLNKTHKEKIDWLVKNVSQTAEKGIPPKATLEAMLKDGRGDLIDHFYKLFTKDLGKPPKINIDKSDLKHPSLVETMMKEESKKLKIVQDPPSVKKTFPPFNVSKEDFTKGWTPTLIERSRARNIYKELEPPASKYTAEMEAIDEELNELMLYGNSKYAHLSPAQKEALHSKLQAEMKHLIAKGEDLTKLSLSQINKKSQDIQKRIRQIANNPDIKGTVSEGPKADMIDAIYKSENTALTNARKIITRNNNLKKYGDKFPRLDPENDTFIITGLDEFGHPNKMSRFTGKFSATKDKQTGELTSSEGTSFYDKWNSKTGKLREEGKEVFHETLDNEGKVIMSNPEYKLPKTELMELQTEFYTDLSTSDLVKKGYELKQIDMILKGREALKYLKKTKNPDVNINMHEQTSTNEIGAVMEDLYHRGDDVYKMSIEEWIKKIPEHFAEGGRTGFHRGSLRHQKTHDYRAYEKSGDWLKQSPPDNWLMTLLGQKKMGAVVPERDAFESYMKERFMYGEQDSPPSNFEQIWADIKKLLDKKRNKHATGGVSNLFQERQGYRSGKAVELITKLPEFLKFVERLLIKASNQIRRGQGKWKDLDIKQKTVQHDNLTKMVTEFQKTKKFDPKMNEYFGIDAEKAFIEAQAQVKKGKIWKSSEGETQAIAMGFDEAGIKGLDQAMKKGTAMSDAMKKMGFNVASANDTVKFDALVSEGMIGFSKEMKEQIIRAKYGDVVNKELLNQMLVDNNPQRLAEVMGTIDEGMVMKEKGMGTDEIITTLKESFKRRPNAEGGLIPGYATGGVSNLFRSR